LKPEIPILGEPKILSGQLHTVLFEIVTHSDRFYNWLQQDFPWHIPALTEWEQTSTYRIQIEELHGNSALSITMPEEAVLIDTRFGHSRPRYYNNCFFETQTGEYEYQLEYDLATQTLKVNLGKIFCTSQLEFTYFILCGLLQNFTLAFHKLLFVHSAVLARGNTGILLLGDSGAGKTTVTFQMVQSGFSLLSDDSPLFTCHNGLVYALGSFDDSHLTPETLAMFPALSQHSSTVPNRFGKYRIDRASLPAGKWTWGPVQIKHILHLNRQPGSDLSIQPSDKHATLHEILEHAMVVFQRPQLYEQQPLLAEATDFAFQTITQLVEDAQIYTLNYANEHLPELPARIDALL
jgi:hypothetical protein